MKNIVFRSAAAIAAMATFATAAQAGPNVAVHESAGGTDFYVGGAAGVNTPAVGNNADTAVTSVQNQFTITGAVTKDCSVYAGTTGRALRTVDVGQIGVNTQDNISNSNAFEMVSPIHVDITSWNAGCNFNNTVSLAKSAAGLVNATPGGYDSAQFTANIPYTLSALFVAPTSQSGAAGAPGQNLQVGLNSATNSGNYGAWRSRLMLQVDAPAITDRALVAGTYQDTITVTLAAS